MTVVVVQNPLKASDRTIIQITQATVARDLVPGAVNARVVVNGIEGTLDSVIQPNDTAAIVVLPGLEAISAAFIAIGKWYGTLSALQKFGVYLAFSFASSAIINAIFKPKKPAGQEAGTDPSPTYSIGAANNQARLGAAIPVVYGNVPRYTADYAAQPYVEFQGD